MAGLMCRCALAARSIVYRNNVSSLPRYGGWSSMQKVVEGLAGKMFDEEKVQQVIV